MTKIKHIFEIKVNDALNQQCVETELIHLKFPFKVKLVMKLFSQHTSSSRKYHSHVSLTIWLFFPFKNVSPMSTA
jgi:hypothetical protein